MPAVAKQALHGTVTCTYGPSRICSTALSGAGELFKGYVALLDYGWVLLLSGFCKGCTFRLCSGCTALMGGAGVMCAPWFMRP
jgi:hypothetical protein